MTKAKKRSVAVLFLMGWGLLFPAPRASADDFGKIVRHIEVQYHVHRNYRFLMAVAGIGVKCTQFTGVKVFKAAIFKNQQLSGAKLDRGLDELMQRAGTAGWQPLVKSFSRRSGEHNYIYAQASGNDMKLLVVSVESDEAVVLEVKVDPNKLSDFINEHCKETDRD
jgi:hypothetical protein